MKFLYVVALILASCAADVYARSVITGFVRDGETKQPLRGVSMRLEGTALGSNTNKDGRFIIRSIPEGRYSLLASLLGYNSVKKVVVVKQGDTTVMDIEMTEQAIQTSEVVVSANKRVQAVQDVPISVSVVDQNAIQQRNINRLDEALRYVPGVNVSGSQVSIRGSSGFAYGLGSRVSLLLDNFPLLSADNGDMAFDALPMFDLERIEVVKGAGSALYGTSALGGVVNVITREPKDFPEFRFRSYSGIYTRPRFDDWLPQEKLAHVSGFDASYSQKIGQVGWILSGGMKNDDGYRRFNDADRWNIFNKISYSPTALTNVTGFVQYAYEDRANWLNWRSLAFATLPPVGTNLEDRLRSRKLAAGGEYKQILSGNTFIIARGSVYRTWYENNVGSDRPDYVAADARQMNTEVQLTTQFNDNIAFTGGLNLMRNDVESPYLTGSRGQLLLSGYGQTEISNKDDVTLTVGARLDREETFGQAVNLEFSPKVGLSYKAPTETQIRVSVGRAFRAASITERFAALRFLSFNVTKNLDLRSEKSWSFEVGAAQTLTILGAPFSFDLALFQSEMFDLIEPSFIEQGGTAQIQFQNVRRARIQGLEASMKGWIGDKLFGFETSLTAMNPRDLIENITLRYRHSILWTSRILIPYNAAELQFDYRYLARWENVEERVTQYNLVANADVRVPIHVVDARLIWDFNKSSALPVRASLNVKNLFDYYYVDSIGNLGLTRQLTIQFDARL
ncbi:MAG: TonB-dependent receptor [Candidatus Kapabacteria bacterium]|nr:TonB-dependent receptor [Candidatus Kapabacteria bacterium]